MCSLTGVYSAHVLLFLDLYIHLHLHFEVNMNTSEIRHYVALQIVHVVCRIVWRDYKVYPEPASMPYQHLPLALSLSLYLYCYERLKQEPKNRSFAPRTPCRCNSNRDSKKESRM